MVVIMQIAIRLEIGGEKFAVRPQLTQGEIDSLNYLGLHVEDVGVVLEGIGEQACMFVEDNFGIIKFEGEDVHPTMVDFAMPSARWNSIHAQVKSAMVTYVSAVRVTRGASAIPSDDA